MACEDFPKSAQLFFPLKLGLVGDEKKLHSCVQTHGQRVSLWEVFDGKCPKGKDSESSRELSPVFLPWLCQCQRAKMW